MPVSSFAPILAQAATEGEGPAGAAMAIFRQIVPDQSAYGLGAATAALIMGIIIQILSYWIAAKVVVGDEHATLARASHLWLLSLLVGLGLAVLLIVALLLAATAQQPTLLMLVGGGWLLLSLLIALLLPAKVFQTGLLRSLGVLVLSFLLVLAAQTALDQARGQSTSARWRPLQALISETPEGRQRRVRQLIHRDPLAAIELELDRLASPEERKKTFTDRQEGLRSVFAALEQHRKTIASDNPTALADYEAVRQRYEGLVNLMRADYAASLAPQPAR